MQIDSYVSERRRAQKKRRGYFWAAVMFLAVYFVCLGIFLFIVRSPAFQAAQIVIRGADAVPQADIMDLLRASVINDGAAIGGGQAAGGHNGMKALLGFKNMLVWPDALPSGTLALIPRLAGVTISKDYLFHTITVTVTERQPFAVWCLMSDQQCFWFDANGTIFAKAFDTQGNAILVVRDYARNDPGEPDSAANFGLNEKILPDKFLPNLLAAVNAIQASGLNIQEVAIRDFSLQQIDATVANGPTLYFSLRFSPDNDLAVLKSLMAKPGFDKLQYVDFTVQNRVYYK